MWTTATLIPFFWFIHNLSLPHSILLVTLRSSSSTVKVTWKSRFNCFHFPPFFLRGSDPFLGWKQRLLKYCFFSSSYPKLGLIFTYRNVSSLLRKYTLISSHSPVNKYVYFFFLFSKVILLCLNKTQGRSKVYCLSCICYR